MKIYKTDTSTETYIEEDCYIIEIVNDKDHDMSIARSRVLPGVTTKMHSLTNTKEVYYITEGRGLMHVDGEEEQLEKGDCIIIQAGEPQRITNTGTGELIFLCICHPRFEFRNYKDLHK